ncbi:MAG: CDP-alcohol phosphatidyltransferase family protein, partial [Atopobiaceae bacterium]|nr:CDP-alcohol phosphatidyltransferase family protein [Atopobiaceae bacterium]
MTLEDADRSTAREPSVSLEGSSESPSREVFTIANLITFTRLILILVFLWLFGATPYRTAAIVVFVVAAVSDFLDGVIARNTGSVSWLGKVLDPIVDRFLLFTGIIGLLIREELPLWMGILLIVRDLILAYGMQMVHKYRSRPVDVIFIG